MFVAGFWICDQRARGGDEELVLVGVLGIGPLGDERGLLLVEAIGEAFQEEEAEDEVLVVARVNRPAEDVRRRPEVALQPIDGEPLVRGHVDCLGRDRRAVRAPVRPPPAEDALGRRPRGRTVR